jgi:hypothetical protein
VIYNSKPLTTHSSATKGQALLNTSSKLFSRYLISLLFLMTCDRSPPELVSCFLMIVFDCSFVITVVLMTSR